MSRPEHIRCILDERATNAMDRARARGVTLCGREVTRLGGPDHAPDYVDEHGPVWDIGHSFYSVRSGSRYQPCPKCARVVIKTMGGGIITEKG